MFVSTASDEDARADGCYSQKGQDVTPRYATAEDAAIVFMVIVATEAPLFTLTLGGKKVHVDSAGKPEQLAPHTCSL